MNSLSGIRALLSSSAFDKRADYGGRGCSRITHLDRLLDSYRRIHIRQWLQHPHVSAALRASSVSAHPGESCCFHADLGPAFFVFWTLSSFWTPSHSQQYMQGQQQGLHYMRQQRAGGF